MTSIYNILFKAIQKRVYCRFPNYIFIQRYTIFGFVRHWENSIFFGVKGVVVFW